MFLFTCRDVSQYSFMIKVILVETEYMGNFQSTMIKQYVAAVFLAFR